MILIQYCLVFILIIAVKGYESGFEKDSVDDANETTRDKRDNIETIIEDIENIAIIAENDRRKGIIPEDQIEKSQSQILNKFEDIAEYIQDVADAYTFLNADGINRIVLTNFETENEQTVKVLLKILKTLFEVVPITVKAVIPANIVDKLLEIFESGDPQAKSIALDIMLIWLPNNPKIQARIMKMKGLEPFYNQISKLDTVGINKMLHLFNTILEEHLKVRNTTQKTKQDYTDSNIYKRIGLIERMSTPVVCNGLLNILELSANQGDISLEIFKLVRSVQKFCYNIYRGKSKAIKLFGDIYEYLSSGKVTGLYDIDEKEAIKKYVEDLKVVRNEL